MVIESDYLKTSGAQGQEGRGEADLKQRLSSTSNASLPLCEITNLVKAKIAKMEGGAKQ